MSLRKIYLGGKLGKLFGKEWELDVASVGEAIRAININTGRKLEQYLTTKGALKHYKVCVKNKKNILLKEEINTPYENGDIYIIPVIKGAGKNGLLQTIIGIVLVVVGVIFDRSGTLIKMGIGLALGGIVQMLMPLPKDNEQRSSFLFQGNASTTYQGAPVGTVYGRAIVAPMPVCLSMETRDENTISSNESVFDQMAYAAIRAQA